MHSSFWTSLFGGKAATTLSPAQMWARAAQSAVLGFVVAFAASWLYALVRGNDFTVGGAMPAAVGAGIGLGAVILVNTRQRRRGATPPDDDSFDNLPKRLG